VRTAFSLLLIHLLLWSVIAGQTPSASSGATNSVQLSKGERATQSATEPRELKIPAGTALDVEATYTVISLDVHPEDLISFRVIVPVKIDGVTVIEKSSLVTGRVVQAKRGGHWGKAGKLSWVMQDVVAVDLTRVPVQAQREDPVSKREVKGTSHGGQVAANMIVMGSLLWPIAPVVLLQGFKRGVNAVLPERKRFIVFVKSDTVVKAAAER